MATAIPPGELELDRVGEGVHTPPPLIVGDSASRLLRETAEARGTGQARVDEVIDTAVAGEVHDGDDGGIGEVMAVVGDVSAVLLSPPAEVRGTFLIGGGEPGEERSWKAGSTLVAVVGRTLSGATTPADDDSEVELLLLLVEALLPGEWSCRLPVAGGGGVEVDDGACTL